MLKLSLAFLSLALFVVNVQAKNIHSLFADGHDPKKIHAVLVSGVNSMGSTEEVQGNYAAEAEVAQTYHLLIDNGVPADNIILFMDGGFANHEVNPWPGTLYTDVNRSRNYNEGLHIDYEGKDVTAQNFLAVIQGEKDEVSGGNGRVLKSNENDRIFISHESHGGPGLLVINRDLLVLEDLHDALNYMNGKKMFKELVYYVMACHSGSMFAGHLDKNGNIYAATAANPNEDAAGTVNIGKDGKMIWINTEFGSAWMTDTLSHDSDSETLEEQFEDVKSLVHVSHPSQYGNLKITKDKVADFEGETKHSDKPKTIVKSKDNEEGIPISPIAEYVLLKRQMEKAKSFAEQTELSEKLRKMEEEQQSLIDAAHKIVQSLYNPKFSSLAMDQFDKTPDMIKELSCHNNVIKSFKKQCQGTRKSIFFNKFFIPMVNLCEQGVESSKIIAEMKKHCLN